MRTINLQNRFFLCYCNFADPCNSYHLEVIKTFYVQVNVSDVVESAKNVLVYIF
jgi:hypothetical protein